MKSKLVKGKIVIETEIVVENFYGEDAGKCVMSAFRANRDEIICQAFESDGVKVELAGPVVKDSDLPKGWSVDCLPWLPSIAFGSKEQERNIGSFLKK